MSISTFEETIGHLKTRWQHADKRFLRQFFPLLAEGRPIPLSHLTEITHKDIAAVERELEKGYAGRDTKGNVIELFGVMQSASLHRIQLGPVCPKKICGYSLNAALMMIFAANEMLLAGMDPNGIRFKRASCFYVGLECGGWGRIVLELRVEEKMPDIDQGQDS